MSEKVEGIKGPLCETAPKPEKEAEWRCWATNSLTLAFFRTILISKRFGSTQRVNNMLDCCNIAIMSVVCVCVLFLF